MPHGFMMYPSSLNTTELAPELKQRLCQTTPNMYTVSEACNADIRNALHVLQCSSIMLL